MKKIFVPLAFIIAGSAVTGMVMYVRGQEMLVLQPAGWISEIQHNLFIFAILLSLLALIPVFVLTAFIAIRYRASNDKASYRPDWTFNPILSLAWWVLIGSIITVIAVTIWNSTHLLDPMEPLPSDNKAMTIQVVSLQWKWLFIYPEQDLATVNYVVMPENTPVTFELTADSPMTSFWIPQLGGQNYAMEGMVNKLNLMADKPGEYQGLNAEISGEYFADMRFKAKAMTEDDFANWVTEAKSDGGHLDQSTYDALAEHSTSDTLTYSSRQASLYNDIVMKYMPETGSADHHH